MSVQNRDRLQTPVCYSDSRIAEGGGTVSPVNNRHLSNKHSPAKFKVAGCNVLARCHLKLKCFAPLGLPRHIHGNLQVRYQEHGYAALDLLFFAT